MDAKIRIFLAPTKSFALFNVDEVFCRAIEYQKTSAWYSDALLSTITIKILTLTFRRIVMRARIVCLRKTMWTCFLPQELWLIALGS